MSDYLIALEREGVPPLLHIHESFLHRLNYFIRLWILKICTSISFTVDRYVRPLSLPQRPTLIKYYPCRPGLQTRIFFPPNYHTGDLLPLFIDMHGGGFALGDPQQDDEFCSMWAKRTGMLVVSLDYSKTPLHPFPAAVYDIAALVNSILEDSSLPISKTQIAMGGFSSGGNLALSASQLPSLKGRIKAALVFYPAVEWSLHSDEKIAMLPYQSGSPDPFERSSWWFHWGYVVPGQNRRDPLLSPLYAKKEDLPPWVYIIGAEWDLFRLEGLALSHKLAGLKVKDNQGQDFETETYKWTLARGRSHGFTHSFGHTPEQKKNRQQKCEYIYEKAHEWLQKALAEEDGENSSEQIIRDRPSILSKL